MKAESPIRATSTPVEPSTCPPSSCPGHYPRRWATTGTLSPWALLPVGDPVVVCLVRSTFRVNARQISVKVGRPWYCEGCYDSSHLTRRPYVRAAPFRRSAPLSPRIVPIPPGPTSRLYPSADRPPVPTTPSTPRPSRHLADHCFGPLPHATRSSGLASPPPQQRRPRTCRVGLHSEAIWKEYPRNYATFFPFFGYLNGGCPLFGSG
jgi:hypothetical protein